MPLKTYLEYTDEKSSKFWMIEVHKDSYTVTYGKQNTKGQQITKSADSNEKALKDAKRLIASKVKKGYTVVSSEESQVTEEKGWFENLEDTVYNIYKNEILRYKQGDYRSIRLTRRGSYDQYALGLETKENGDYWEGINGAYDYEYEVFENLCYDAFGENGIKNNWPSDDHYFQLDAFLTSIILGKVYLQLKQTPELNEYLKHISTITIDFDDSHMLPFADYFPDEATRAVFVKKVAGDVSNQQLISDLWADKLGGAGIDFLTQLQIPLPKKVDSTIEQFDSILETSISLWEKDKTKKAIKLLEPALLDLVTKNNGSQNGLIEKACGYFASYFKELKLIPEAVKAYQVGIAHLPSGYSTLNLLSLLKKSAFNNELMFSTAETLVKKGQFNDKEYRFYAFYYLGYASIITEREKEAKKTFQTIKTSIDSSKDLNKVEEIIKDLSTLIKSEAQGFKIAKEIRPLFEGGIQEIDKKKEDKLNEWWTSVPSRVKSTAMKYAKVKGAANELAPSALLRVSRMDFLPLMQHELEDISFLTGFTHLETLYLNRNQIVDISVLSKCFTLKELHISNNPMTSIAPLKSLYRLEKLEAGRCDIENISVLSNLRRLEALELNDNKISEIEALNNLHGLKELNLSDNVISDVSVIGTCKGLSKLELEDNPIEKGMEGIAKLPLLQEIELDYGLAEAYLRDLPYLSKDWGYWETNASDEEKNELNNWLRDVKAHPKFKEIWWKDESLSIRELAEFVYTKDYVDLKNKDLKDVSDLTLLNIFQRCNYLDLKNTKISNLEGIENLSFLEYLIVSDNDIYDISIVENFEHLETLRASNCGLSSLRKMEKCSNLKNLHIGDNNLKDLFPLDELENLVHFSASNNKLTDIKPLANHKKLSQITIEKNEYALDLSPLASCKELTSIICSSPRGVTGLATLAKLPLLRKVETNGTASKIQMDLLRKKNPNLLIN